MQDNKALAKTIPFAAAGLLFTLGILMVLPSTSRAIFQGLGINVPGNDSPAYNGFEPFIPYVPGYFPEDFNITHVSNGAHLSSDINTYTETYASDDFFFALIESHGSAVPELISDKDFFIQGKPASLTSSLALELSADDELNPSRFNTEDAWTVSVVFEEIYIQIVTNLPRQEAIQLAEGLVPAICTSKPTSEK